MQRKAEQSGAYVVLTAIGDIFWVQAMVGVAFLLRFLGWPPAYNLDAYLRLAPWVTVAVVGVMAGLDLYDGRYRRVEDLRRRVLLAVALLAAAMLAASFLIADQGFPRSVFALSALLDFPALYLWRRWWRERWFADRITRVVQFSDRPSAPPVVSPAELGEAPEFRVLPLAALATEAWQDADVVLVGEDVGDDDKEKIFLSALYRGIPCLWRPTTREGLLAHATLAVVGGLPVLSLSPMTPAPWQRLGKRLLDLGLSVALLLVALPLMAAIAVAIVLDSGWPVFYRQDRVTRGGRIFRLIKFRTLTQNFELLYGAGLTPPDHAGVTRVGRFLRATHLDEIPQLFNVIRGDMSLVGPRPERPFLVEDFVRQNPAYGLRHGVQPGITGLAQVSGHYFTPFEEKLQLDLAYSRRLSLWHDLKLLLQTAEHLLFPRPPKPPSSSL